jgi:hypothetical protein
VPEWQEKLVVIWPDVRAEGLAKYVLVASEKVPKMLFLDGNSRINIEKRN